MRQERTFGLWRLLRRFAVRLHCHPALQRQSAAALEKGSN
jgi:hypothetical protein